jgi:phosphate transport system substrate-binding protein
MCGRLEEVDHFTGEVAMNRRRTIAMGMGSLVCLAILWPASAPAEHPGRTHTQPVDPQIAAYAPTRDLAGRLTIAGSDTMQPLLVKLANDFTRHHPSVRFVIEDVGSGEAIKEFIHGYSLQRRGEKARKGHNGATELNLLASSRLMTDPEIATFSSMNGYEPLAIPIAMDAVTVYVNRDNPIQSLTLAQLDAIFGRERRRGYADDITTWGQVGLADRWQGQPIRAYGRSKGSGTRDQGDPRFGLGDFGHRPRSPGHRVRRHGVSDFPCESRSDCRGPGETLCYPQFGFGDQRQLPAPAPSVPLRR